MPFRNDFAFSIALGMLNGHTITDNNLIKWPLTTASTNVVVRVEDDTIKLEYEKNNKHMRLELRELDLHVMNKKAMEEICASS